MVTAVRPKRKKVSNREEINGFIFALIPLLGIVLFSLVPMVISLVSVFFDMRGTRIGSMQWDNFANFKTLSKDWTFWKSIPIDLILTLPQFISLLIALVTAVFLDQKIRGSKVFMAVFFIPFICSSVASAVMWQWIFNSNFGIVNDVLVRCFGPVAKVNWFVDPKAFMAMLIIAMVWNMPGYGITMYTAALTAVNRNFYEAAEIDGAGKVRQFFSITLPAISPTTFFLFMVGIINGMQTFDIINIFAPSGWEIGGGPNGVAISTVFYIYDTATRGSNLPYASLMSWVLFLMLVVLSIVNFKLSDKWVSYD